MCCIGLQASAGNLDEAAGMMAQLIVQMDEGIMRACVILTLSTLRASMLIRSLSALRALNALLNCVARTQLRSPPVCIPPRSKVTFSAVSKDQAHSAR